MNTKKRVRGCNIDPDRDLLPSQMACLVKMYVEQAVKTTGLSVDKLAYSDQIRAMTAEISEKYPGKILTEKDVYTILMFLRKTGKLPKVFRSEIGEANG